MIQYSVRMAENTSTMPLLGSVINLFGPRKEVQPAALLDGWELAAGKSLFDQNCGVALGIHTSYTTKSPDSGPADLHVHPQGLPSTNRGKVRSSMIKHQTDALSQPGWTLCCCWTVCFHSRRFQSSLHISPWAENRARWHFDGDTAKDMFLVADRCMW